MGTPQTLLPFSREADASRDPPWLESIRRRAESDWRRLRRSAERSVELSADATLILGDAVEWLDAAPEASVHAVVTDPPYGVIEYQEKNQAKLRSGRGGVWRIPPSFDGAKRNPLPRFTVLSSEEVNLLRTFFKAVAERLLRVLVPGGHVFIASNPLLSSMTFCAFQEAGLEKRGEVIRIVQTLRGGDRPKGAEAEFPEVSVMARSSWEPWGIFRKPCEGTVAENLRVWGAGGLRRISAREPFKDVIACSPTRGREKALAPHPSLKPQRFLRQIVRAALPLGIGVVYDPFAGSASTLAAAEALGYRSLGTERDHEYYEMAQKAFPRLAALSVR
ncbi:MAG: site-specific DNA-methyltransferase [Planctomycetes bacterium]|nr:site-specific DNA-methyltransferase [Planctomycetota bacterium]